MDLGLKNKVALVAASSKGIGYGIAEALAWEGVSVSIASRDERSIHVAAERIGREANADIRPYVMDASDKDSIERWVSQSAHDFGGIDILVINAGGPPAGKFSDLTEEHWHHAFQLTLMSAVRMVHASVPEMRKRGGGSILAVTSSSVKEPIENLLLSNVFRSGVTSLIKSLAHEFAKDNIRVNNIVPGRIDTDRVRSLDRINADRNGISEETQRSKSEASIPMGRYGSIEEFGRAAAFLVSPAASYTTGETFQVDGGLIKTVW